MLLAAGDTFRAAAAEQLTTWAERSGAEIVRGAEGGDPSSVIFDGVERAAARNIDLVMADTAGRLHTKSNLMDELRKVRRVAEKGTGRVTETLLVIDATTGQNGLIQAREFREATDVTGVVLTKLDGSAKGGIVFAIETELGIPVKLVGTGETIGDLIPFVPAEFVSALVRVATRTSTFVTRILGPGAQKFLSQTRNDGRRLGVVVGVSGTLDGMTVTEAPSTARSTDPETARVEAALDALLAAHDPKTMDNIAFRGARYDAGLAWVHFPERFGGLGVRPDLNKLVESRLRAAGRAADQSGDVLHGPRRPDHRHPRQRRGPRAVPAPDVHRRGGLVPAVLRAGRGFRLRRAGHQGRP